MNSSKSLFFTIDEFNSFNNNICNILRCYGDTAPFNYLGLHIFSGSPKRRFFQPSANRVKSKLLSLKGKCLNMMGHMQLVTC